MPTDPKKVVCLKGKSPAEVAVHLESLGYKCVSAATYDPATGKNKTSWVYRYDDPNSDTVHFVRIDDKGHDVNPAFAGAPAHYHVDTCDKSKPSSPNRDGSFNTDADGNVLSQDKNYEGHYEPGAVTYNDSGERVDKPGGDPAHAAPDMGAWAQDTHLPAG